MCHLSLCFPDCFLASALSQSSLIHPTCDSCSSEQRTATRWLSQSWRRWDITRGFAVKWVASIEKVIFFRTQTAFTVRSSFLPFSPTFFSKCCQRWSSLRRKSAIKAPTWPSCFAYPSLQAECSVSACWTLFCIRLVQHSAHPRTFLKYQVRETSYVASGQTAEPSWSKSALLCSAVYMKHLSLFFSELFFPSIMVITMMMMMMVMIIWSVSVFCVINVISLLWKTTWS